MGVPRQSKGSGRKSHRFSNVLHQGRFVRCVGEGGQYPPETKALGRNAKGPGQIHSGTVIKSRAPSPLRSGCLPGQTIYFPMFSQSALARVLAMCPYRSVVGTDRRAVRRKKSAGSAIPPYQISSQPTSSRGGMSDLPHGIRVYWRYSRAKSESGINPLEFLFATSYYLL